MQINSICNIFNNYTNMSSDINFLNREESLMRLGLLLIVGTLSFIGIIANVHVLYVFVAKIRRSTYRVFILSLAIIDILGCTISMPFQIIDETHPYNFTSAIACKIFRYIDTNLAISAALMLVVIASERYRKICRPKGKQVTEIKAIYNIVAVVIGSSLVTSPALIVYGKKSVQIEGHNLTGFECSWDDSITADSIYGYMYYSLELLCIVMCMISLVILYSLVGAALRRHRKTVSKRLVARYTSNRNSNGAKILHKTEDGEEISIDKIIAINEVSVTDDSDTEEIDTQTGNISKIIKEKQNQILKAKDEDTKNTAYVTDCEFRKVRDFIRKIEEMEVKTDKNIGVNDVDSDSIKIIEDALNSAETSEDGKSIVIPEIIIQECSSILECDDTGRESGVSDTDELDVKVRSQKVVKFKEDETNIEKRSSVFLEAFRARLKSKNSKILSNLFSFYFKRKAKRVDAARERRITKLLFTITITFIITYFPYIAILVVYALNPSFQDNLTDTSRVFYLLALRLYLINNVANAFFYGFFDIEFRNHLKNIYKRFFGRCFHSRSMKLARQFSHSKFKEQNKTGGNEGNA